MRTEGTFSEAVASALWLFLRLSNTAFTRLLSNLSPLLLSLNMSTVAQGPGGRRLP